MGQSPEAGWDQILVVCEAPGRPTYKDEDYNIYDTNASVRHCAKRVQVKLLNCVRT